MKEKINIFDMGIHGEGIGKIDDKICFIPYAIKGEKIVAEIDKDNNNYYSGELLSVVDSSKNRQEPHCQYFKKCGGCALQHLEYDSSLLYKSDIVKRTFKRVANLDVQVGETIASDNKYHYRNKCVFAVGLQNDKTVVGMFENNTHNIVEIKECKIADKIINKILQNVKEYINDNNILGYDFKNNTGFLKYVMIRVVKHGVCVVFVTTKAGIKLDNNFINCLPSQSSVFENINTDTKKILSDNMKLIFGEEVLFDNFFGLTQPISPLSFLQINDNVKNKLYQDVLSRLNGETVVDAFCGAGLMSCMIALKSKKVIGIEIVEQAIKNAKMLAQINNIHNVNFICGDCAKLLQKEILSIKQSFSLVLDPPRTGVGIKLMKQINNCNAQKILYISCNPATLARDIKELSNYYIKIVQPYDMFPQTSNIETLVELTKTGR